MSAQPSSSIQRGARRGAISGTMIAVIVAAVLVVGGVAAYYAFFSTPGREIVRVDGSSTVFPITSAWATGFNTPNRQVIVAFSGTGGGFQKFCRGETDLSDASRPIRQSELDACAASGITVSLPQHEFLVAYDGLSIVVNNANAFVDHLTVAELCRIWTSNTSAGACGGAGPRVTSWNELDATWPAQAIELYGPGTASGTFDYFIEVILDPTGDEITAEFFPSEDDNVLVQGVAGNTYALGYFGYAYAIENTDTIRIVAVDGGAGPVVPSSTTIRDGTYTPLSRPLFVYANARSVERPAVREFLRFGLSATGMSLVDQTGYISLTETERLAELAKVP